MSLTGDRRSAPSGRRPALAVCFVLALWPTARGGAQATPAAEAHSLLVAFPTASYYPPPIADPHRPAFGVAFNETYNVGIADSGSSRFGLRVGGAFGLLRWVRARAQGELGLQLDILAGIDGQFDVDHRYDNIGWDGNYGLQVSAPWGEAAALKLAVLHTSSHIGDELIERTSRRRIDYTREELVAGVNRRLGGGFSVYGEIGWAYELRNRDLQEPMRLQTGLDFDPTRAPQRRSRAWFLGLDFSATEERDYRIDVALKAGRTFRVEERCWRLGVELYHGRPNLGEFFQDTEAHVALGVWLDL